MPLWIRNQTVPVKSLFHRFGRIGRQSWTIDVYLHSETTDPTLDEREKRYCVSVKRGTVQICDREGRYHSISSAYEAGLIALYGFDPRRR